MNKQQAKEKIKKLVKRYEKLDKKACLYFFKKP